jgi:hypothetical protein
MLNVGGIVASCHDGLWLTLGCVPLGDKKIQAIFKFLKAEEDQLELICSVKIRSLLDELGISYQIR